MNRCNWGNSSTYFPHFEDWCETEVKNTHIDKHQTGRQQQPGVTAPSGANSGLDVAHPQGWEHSAGTWMGPGLLGRKKFQLMKPAGVHWHRREGNPRKCLQTPCWSWERFELCLVEGSAATSVFFFVKLEHSSQQAAAFHRWLRTHLLA